MKLWSQIKNAMMKHPKQTVCENEAEMTFEDLVVYAEHFAERLKGQACCAILCQSEMTAAMALLGCFAAEVTALPLCVRYGEKHYQKSLDMIGPTAVITDAAGELEMMDYKDSSYVVPVQHPALIMCTSGTTGSPKGVMLSETNILTNLLDIASYFHIQEDDTILIARPLYHCAVLTGEFLLSLVKGARIRFCSEAFNPHTLAHLLKERQITVFGATPTMMNSMLRFIPDDGIKSLKRISISGECMREPLGQEISKMFPNADIYHVYGLTEASPRVSYLPPEYFRTNPSSVGIPLPSVTVKIVREDDTPVSPNEDGILWVKGGNVMLGYYNDPDQTTRKIRNGWLCTGDIASMDAQGFLTIKSRMDDMIIRGGVNIYPQEVENALLADKRVREAQVYGILNPRLGMQLGIKIAGDFANIREVKHFCMEKLPPFQVPSFYELLDELPKNSSGKMVRGFYGD